MDLTEIRKLIQLVKRTKIGELEITENGRTIRISAMPESAPAPPTVVSVPAEAGNSRAAAPAAPQPAEAQAATPSAEEARQQPVASPMVGTFYRAPAPDADPYVDVGDHVEVGQTLCIVEAMKLMNEIESEVRGRVVRVEVENGQPVEFGQALFLIDPQG